MRALFLREWSAYLNSLMAYVVILVFLLVTGLIMWVFPDYSLLQYGYAHLDQLFSMGPWILMFLIPAITMRFFSEERRSGTLELLYTSPITDTQIILGKYLAATALVAFALLPTLFYAVSLWFLADPVGNIDTGGIAGSYMGLLLLGAAFVSLGLLASALTENQLVAFILGVFFCFFSYSAFDSLYLLPIDGRIQHIVEQLGLGAHYYALSKGVIDTRDLVFFLSFIGLFLALTRQALNKKKWFRLVLWIGILVSANVLASFLYTRLDLTREQRYTVSPSTARLLQSLDDVVYVHVYLEGEFPPGFRKLRDAVRDQLTEMRRLSGGKLEFTFTDPSDQPDEKTANQLYEQLYKLGLQPTDLENRTTEGVTRKVVWPGAVVYYRNKEIATNFLLGSGAGNSPQEILNASEEGLEYALVRAIRNATQKKQPTVAFSEGHGELDGRSVSDMAAALSDQYKLTRYNIKTIEPIPADVDVLVVAKPTEPFTDWSRYKIDHFLMRGGRILWMVDAVAAEMDSMTPENYFMAMDRSLNLDDMMFRYGIRINPDLVQDVRCGPIPVVYGMLAGQPQQKLFPWPYFPLVNGNQTHPITRNIDPVYLRFAGTIDYVGTDQLQRTVLLQSGSQSRRMMSPARVNLNLALEPDDPSAYNRPGQSLAVLLEGRFPSALHNRYLNDFAQRASDSLNMKPIKESAPTRMVVVADGDIIRNDVSKRSGDILPLGYDRYSRQIYGNKVFLQNTIDYLVDREGLLNIRSRQIRLRLLDSEKVKSQQLLWQLFNLGLPIGLLFIFGGIRYRLRVRKFGQKHPNYA